jgi:hypothetical protein
MNQTVHFDYNIFTGYFRVVYPKVGDRSETINMQFAATFIDILDV